MDDLIFISVFLVMMLLAYGYIRLCDRIVGEPDPTGRTRDDLP